MRAFRIVITTMLAICYGAEAMAQGAPRSPVEAPQSDSIARAAFIATMDGEFRKMDADRNGTLTRKEIEDLQRATAMLAAQQRNAAFFQALDKDKNGQLSAGEFAALPMNVPLPNAAPVLAQVDGNRDGQVTMIEYRAGKLVNFDRMDSDKDGVVTVAEMKAAGLIK